MVAAVYRVPGRVHLRIGCYSDILILGRELTSSRGALIVTAAPKESQRRRGCRRAALRHRIDRRLIACTHGAFSARSGGKETAYNAYIIYNHVTPQAIHSFYHSESCPVDVAIDDSH